MRIKHTLAWPALFLLTACDPPADKPKTAGDAAKTVCDPTRQQCPVRQCAPGEEPVQMPNPIQVDSSLGANASTRPSCIKPPA
jgi:hypothetical protein